MLVLGIETSCDETACAVVEDGDKVLSDVVGSSLPLHRRFGGVVPEIACRAHVESINYILDQALRQAKVRLKDVDVVSVTYGPGLVGALLIGISLSKAIALSLKIPLVGINHLAAHLEVNFLEHPESKGPFVGLVISGGHTSLVYRASLEDDYELLGQTHDDAVGEAFDKVAKILGLGYPGGPAIEERAKAGDPRKVKFPRPKVRKAPLDFSFSGIKTAVLYYVRDHPSADAGDIACGFQEAVVDTLIEKTLAACRMKRANSILVGGGVAANSRLREKLTELAGDEGIKVSFPRGALCTDNACMVASSGYHQFRRGLTSDLGLSAEPNLGFGRKR